jgi:hypothetical protein
LCKTYVKAVDYTGEQLWERVIDRLFLYDLIQASDTDFIYLVYPEWEDALVSTITKMNLRTGEEAVFWQAKSGQQVATLALTPDEQQVLWVLLFSGDSEELLLDERGQVVRTVTNMYLHWQPNGGVLLYQRDIANGFTYAQHHNFSPLQEVQLPIERLTDFYWSPDGHYLICIGRDSEGDMDFLYLWQPGWEIPDLLWQSQPGDKVTNFHWAPDSRVFYFVLNLHNLSAYDVLTREMSLLAAAP